MTNHFNYSRKDFQFRKPHHTLSNRKLQSLLGALQSNRSSINIHQNIQEQLVEKLFLFKNNSAIKTEVGTVFRHEGGLVSFLENVSSTPGYPTSLITLLEFLSDEHCSLACYKIICICMHFLSVMRSNQISKLVSPCLDSQEY